MQIIYQGIDYLNEALKGSTKVLLVCGSSFPYLGIKDKIEHIGTPFMVFDQFTSNPLYEDICRGVDLFQVTQCDTILAIGGGSSMDVAKCVKLYCQMSKDKPYLQQEYKDTGVKLIAIPTTAGSGSESTCYAVIYHDGKKQSVMHKSIIPDVVILEPKLLKTLPVYQKKCTMLDALCQGIESWWSVNSTDESKRYSKIAVETIIKYWREYIFENTDFSAEQIMLAANYAGRAICITQTTAAHAFSYKITSLYKLPHGHAVAVGLSEIWEYMLLNMNKCLEPRGEEYLWGIFADISKAMGCLTLEQAVVKFRQILTEMEITNPVAINKTEEIEILSHSVNPVRLKNNPVELCEFTIKSLYEIIIK